eukprot:scaffold44390_cov153-Amphora_coffeaeformis.AAC.1
MRTIRSGSDLTATIIPFTMMRMFLVSLLFPFGEPLPAFWPRRGGGGSGSMMAHGEYGSPDEHLEQQLHQDGYLLEFQYVRQFMQDVFESYGVPPDRAAVCADVLLVADERGIHSHGLGRLKPIYCDRMDAGILYPSQDIRVIKETETTALLDGNLGLGLYIGPFAMQMAIQKAKKYGVGFVAVKNSTHYGIAGYYTLMASQNNCIGWTGTNARPSIAPTFGVQPMMGTNPITFGVPSDEPFDFCIDCASSINQRGKIEMYAREGRETPRGCVIDNQGIERTDTEEILKDLVSGKCALTPIGGAGTELGGYKGYGWSTMVELMSIGFQSGPFGKDLSGVDEKTGKKKSMPLGHFFLAINLEALCDPDEFRANVGTFLRALRNSKKSPRGPGRIWTAGEPEHDAYMAQSDMGGMIVPPALQQVMKDLRDSRP